MRPRAGRCTRRHGRAQPDAAVDARAHRQGLGDMSRGVARDADEAAHRAKVTGGTGMHRVNGSGERSRWWRLGHDEPEKNVHGSTKRRW